MPAGDFIPCDEPECTAGTAGPETFIVFDWGDDSNENGEGFSEAAAEALFAALVQASQGPSALVSLDNLHLIGHSRGTVVNSEVAERLIAADFPAPIQVTNLDPHDSGGFGVSGSGSSGEHAPLGFGFEDYDVNSEHPSTDAASRIRTIPLACVPGRGWDSMMRTSKAISLRMEGPFEARPT